MYDDYNDISTEEKKLLHQLRKEFRRSDYPLERKQYTICLDGVNEIDPTQHDSFLLELETALSEWNNVRFIIISRDQSFEFSSNNAFKHLKKYDITGISEEYLKWKYNITDNEENSPYRLIDVLKRPLFFAMYDSLEDKNCR